MQAPTSRPFRTDVRPPESFQSFISRGIGSFAPISRHSGVLPRSNAAVRLSRLELAKLGLVESLGDQCEYEYGGAHQDAMPTKRQGSAPLSMSHLKMPRISIGCALDRRPIANGAHMDVDLQSVV